MIVDSLFQLKNSRSASTIITGDRGIGKSSLLNQSKELATGDNCLPARLGIDMDGEQYDFVVAWHDAAKDQGPSEIAAGVLQDLQNAVTKAVSRLKFEVNIGGALKIGANESKASDITAIVNDFCLAAEKISHQAKNASKHGVIFFVDELDRASPASGIGTFFKLTIEKLGRNKVHNVAFFCAGITGAIQMLEEDHASIFRSFKEVPLPRLPAAETADILKTGYDSVGCTYDEQVFAAIHRLAAGFPEPVHLLGSQSLAVDTDDHVTLEDVETAKVQVIETLRKNKLTAIVRQAGSGNYQNILRAMAEHPRDDVPLSFISKKIGLAQNQYSTNMSTLRQRGVIAQHDRGVYAFVDPLVKEYIKRFGVLSVEPEELDSTNEAPEPADSRR